MLSSTVVFHRHVTTSARSGHWSAFPTGRVTAVMMGNKAIYVVDIIKL